MDQYNFTNSLYIRCWEIARSKENVFNNAQTLNHQKQTLEENFETLKSQLGG
jgi:chaperonin cofactor prefoldin